MACFKDENGIVALLLLLHLAALLPLHAKSDNLYTVKFCSIDSCSPCSIVSMTKMCDSITWFTIDWMKNYRWPMIEVTFRRSIGSSEQELTVGIHASFARHKRFHGYILVCDKHCIIVTHINRAHPCLFYVFLLQYVWVCVCVWSGEGRFLVSFFTFFLVES